MFKNDTMEQYVTDRHPRLARRSAFERIDWTVAAVAQEGRLAAVGTHVRPAAPVFHLAEARMRRATSPSIA